MVDHAKNFETLAMKALESVSLNATLWFTS